MDNNVSYGVMKLSQKGSFDNDADPLTQSKSTTIITRSMLTISLIVFTDKLQANGFSLHSNYKITLKVTIHM